VNRNPTPLQVLQHFCYNSTLTTAFIEVILLSVTPIPVKRAQSTSARIITETLNFFAQPVHIVRNYRRAWLRDDVFSGLTVAAVMLPQAIVFAFIAGMPPASGLYTAIIGSIIAGLWGSSNHAQSGPTNTHSLLTLSVVMTVAKVGTPQFLAAAGLLTMMVGVFRLLVGLTRLGILANFVSDSVIVGFTAGAGVLIAVNQLPHLLGIQLQQSASFSKIIIQLGEQLSATHWPTLAVGLAAILVILLAGKIHRKLPGPFIAIVLAAGAVTLLGLAQQGVAVIGDLPHGLPPLAKIPFTDWQLIGQLSTGALAVGAIGLVQTTSITRSLSSSTRQRVDSNQEFVAQGLANIASGLFSGFLVTTSFNRSALNLQSGAKTQLAAVFSGLFVLMGMLIFAPYAALIPRAALAGVLMVIAYRMIDIHEIRRLLRGGQGDALIMGITLLSTLFLPLAYAVLIGITLSLSRYILSTSMPRVLPLLPDERYKHLEYRPGKAQCPQLSVIEVQGDLYFGAVNHVEAAILENMRQHPSQNYLLLQMNSVQVIDISGIHMLESLLKNYQQAGGDMYLVKVRGQVYERMKDLGFVARLGEDHFLEQDEAISTLFYHVLDPTICIYECETRAFAECQNLPRSQADLAGIPAFSQLPPHAFSFISAQALHKKLRGPHPPVVVDVREPREYQRSHIPQARNLPLAALLNGPLELPKSETIVLTCRTSRRSRRAAYVLQQQGFEQIVLLEGGLLAWENAHLLTAVEYAHDGRSVT
jgi:SulP family sulfate permease